MVTRLLGGKIFKNARKSLPPENENKDINQFNTYVPMHPIYNFKLNLEKHSRSYKISLTLK